MMRCGHTVRSGLSNEEACHGRTTNSFACHPRILSTCVSRWRWGLFDRYFHSESHTVTAEIHKFKCPSAFSMPHLPHTRFNLSCHLQSAPPHLTPQYWASMEVHRHWNNHGEGLPNIGKAVGVRGLWTLMYSRSRKCKSYSRIYCCICIGILEKLWQCMHPGGGLSVV